ncbi:MAG: ribonuclease HI, partial [Thermogutta sp.]|nr:ribonuclease HI [Thermogutta sp.]
MDGSRTAGAEEAARRRPSDRRSATNLPQVLLYSDGACSGNPGPGGWAFILRHPASGKEMVQSGAEPETTNNRMELTAVIRGLEALRRPSRVTVITDSQYVGKGFSEWLPGWRANGWMRKVKGKPVPVKNDDLWRRLAELLDQHDVRFQHVYGHTGHAENERCDQLAVEAYRKLMRG